MPVRPDDPRVDRPVCLIGDLHGRDDLLDRMIDRMAAEPQADAVRVVILGDMIDRGPGSGAVLRRLRDLARDAGWICLMGNHERMLLDFLADPAGHTHWLRHGAAETMASLGCVASPDRPKAAAAELSARLGDLVEWIATRPLIWQEGTLIAAHAGTDPARALTDQREEALLWGRGVGARPDVWTIHGHVIVPQAQMAEGMVNVDTGAWRSGTLSAIWIDADGARFLTVSG